MAKQICCIEKVNRDACDYVCMHAVFVSEWMRHTEWVTCVPAQNECVRSIAEFKTSNKIITLCLH